MSLKRKVFTRCKFFIICTSTRRLDSLQRKSVSPFADAILYLDCAPTYSTISLTLSQTTNFRHFKLKEFADNNFKFDENGRKFSKRVENTVGKGEIGRYEHLPFPTVFSKDIKTRACLVKGLNAGYKITEKQCLTLPTPNTYVRPPSTA